MSYDRELQTAIYAAVKVPLTLKDLKYEIFFFRKKNTFVLFQYQARNARLIDFKVISNFHLISTFSCGIKMESTLVS